MADISYDLVGIWTNSLGFKPVYSLIFSKNLIVDLEICSFAKEFYYFKFNG